MILFPSALPAWDGVGHMLVANVAHERLKPEVRERLDALARRIEYPGNEYNSITMACWMDDIKGGSGEPFQGQFKPWHYIDIGISPGDPVPPFDVTDLRNEAAGNIVQALKRAVAVAKGGTDPLIPNKTVAFCLIVHLVGDIHQPLHCAAYDFPNTGTAGKPDTDRGGNLVSITNSAEESGRTGAHKMNLHSFWDGAYRAKSEGGNVVMTTLPYGGHSVEEIQPFKFDETAYAPDPDASLKTDFEAWALESNQIAKDSIYGALTFDSTHKTTHMSAEDVQKACDLAKKRIVLGGYRLAVLLNDLLSDSSATPDASGIVPAPASDNSTNTAPAPTEPDTNAPPAPAAAPATTEIPPAPAASTNAAP